MPKTRLGRWAGILLVVYAVLLVALLLCMKLVGLVPGTPLIIALGTCMMFAGVAAFITAAISLVKFKDRSLVVMAAAVIGAMATLFFIVETTEIVRGFFSRSTH